MQINDIVEPVKKSGNVERDPFDPRSAIVHSKWKNEHAHADAKEPQKFFLGLEDLLDDRFSGVGNLWRRW